MTKIGNFYLNEILSNDTRHLFPNIAKRDDSVKGVILRYEDSFNKAPQIFTLSKTRDITADDVDYRWRKALRYGPRVKRWPENEELITVSVENMPVIGRYMVVNVGVLFDKWAE